MSRSKLFALARSITLLASVGAPCLAQAADLLPPPPPPPPPVPVEVGGGWYLRGDVGIGATDYDKISTKLADPQASLPDGYQIRNREISDQVFAGVGVGYQFNSFVRADVTAEYRGGGGFGFVETFSNPYLRPYITKEKWQDEDGRWHKKEVIAYNQEPGTGVDYHHGNLSSVVAFANGYVDLGTWFCMTPYVGGGIGAAFHQVSGYYDLGAGSAAPGFGMARTKNTTSLAWNASAGLAMSVTPNLKVDLGYRYSDLGDIKTGQVSCNDDPGCGGASYKVHSIIAHDVRIGLRYLLGGAVAAPLPPLAPAYEPPPAPIVRKY